MAFRPEAVRVRLLRLEKVVSELIELRRLSDEEIRNSQRNQWAIERGLQLGAEVIFDVGNHILTAQYGVSPANYRDILEQLARQKILSEDLWGRLKGLGGFRNILVHDYLEIDLELVLKNLNRAPRDFNDFALALGDWLEGRTPL